MKIEDLIKNNSMGKKDKILAQLERLNYLKNRNVLKFHEYAQLNQLERELAEIEFFERKK
jgi:hypothetical protein